MTARKRSAARPVAVDVDVDEAALRARLTARRELPTTTVPLDGIGDVVVRGLTRGEVFAAQKGLEPGAKFEAGMVAAGMVYPRMTRGDVEQWIANGLAGELEVVTNEIRDLSGLGEGADKSGLSGVREPAGAGVRVLPGDEADDDGEPAPGADE